MQLHRFKENHWWPLTAYQLKILDSVSSSGSGPGFGASSNGDYFEGDRSLKLVQIF
jgi:hypothetical protein